MGPGCVEVPDPFHEDPAHVPLAERNQIVQTFAPDSADHPFANTIRLRRSDGRLENLQSHTPDRFIQPTREFGVPIADQIVIPMISRNGFPELLERPVARRMPRDIEMQDPARRVLNDDEYVEDLEGRCPALVGGSLPRSITDMLGHVLPDRAGRYPQPQLEQELIRDPFLAPCRVFRSHSAYQIPNFAR